MGNKSKLFIIGASSFGRVMESWLDMIPDNERDWRIEGFLHKFEGKSPLLNYPSDYEILGDWEKYPLTKDDFCIIAVSDCAWKEKIYHSLKEKTTFLTYVAPNVTVGKYTTFGEGCIVCPNCVISTNVKVGNCVTINNSTQLGHDVKIGNFSSVMGNVDLTGKVVIGEKVFVGVGSTVLPDVTVGDESKISAGSLVLRNVNNGNTVFGNPAKVIGSIHK